MEREGLEDPGIMSANVPVPDARSAAIRRPTGDSVVTQLWAPHAKSDVTA
jgi:hypothetical protein